MEMIKNKSAIVIYIYIYISVCVTLYIYIQSIESNHSPSVECVASKKRW